VWPGVARVGRRSTAGGGLRLVGAGQGFMALSGGGQRAQAVVRFESEGGPGVAGGQADHGGAGVVGDPPGDAVSLSVHHLSGRDRPKRRTVL